MIHYGEANLDALSHEADDGDGDEDYAVVMILLHSILLVLYHMTEVHPINKTELFLGCLTYTL